MKPELRYQTRSWLPFGSQKIHSMANGITPSVPRPNRSTNYCPVPYPRRQPQDEIEVQPGLSRSSVTRARADRRRSPDAIPVLEQLGEGGQRVPRDRVGDQPEPGQVEEIAQQQEASARPPGIALPPEHRIVAAGRSS